MFGDMMGNMQQKQEELKLKLANIVVTEQLEGITIEGNASREITNISIANEYLSEDRKEELEDLLSVAANNFIAKVAEQEATASQSMINDLLPGMGGMFGS